MDDTDTYRIKCIPGSTVHLFRAVDDIAERIERYRCGIQRQRRGARISTAEVVRLLLGTGLDHGSGTDLSTLPFIHWAGRKPKLAKPVKVRTKTGLSALQTLQEDRG